MTKETPTGTHTESEVILTFTTLDTNMRCPEGVCSNESRLYPDLAYIAGPWKYKMGARRRHPDSTGIFFMALEDIVYFWVIHKTTVNKNAIMTVTSTTQSYKLQSVEP